MSTWRPKLLREIWSSPAYNHCMFTARPDLHFEWERRFAEALSAMSYENPVHRSILDAEGLQRWLPPHMEGYAALRRAAAEQGFFKAISPSRPERLMGSGAAGTA